jgi:hypothetical protein
MSSSTSVVDAAGPADNTPSGGAPSMSSVTVVVNAAGPTSSAPQGAHHRCLLQPWWGTLLNSSTTPPKGPAIDILQQVVAVASIYCQRLPAGHCGKSSLLGVLQSRHFVRIFSNPCNAKDSKKTPVKKISSNITKSEFIYKTKVSAPQVEMGSPVRLQDGARTAQLQASQFPEHRPVQPPELSQRVLAPPSLGKPGVLAAEAQQHVLCNYLRHDAALCLQPAGDDIF